MSWKGLRFTFHEKRNWGRPKGRKTLTCQAQAGGSDSSKCVCIYFLFFEFSQEHDAIWRHAYFPIKVHKIAQAGPQELHPWSQAGLKGSHYISQHCIMHHNPQNISSQWLVLSYAKTCVIIPMLQGQKQAKRGGLPGLRWHSWKVAQPGGKPSWAGPNAPSCNHSRNTTLFHAVNPVFWWGRNRRNYWSEKQN